MKIYPQIPPSEKSPVSSRPAWIESDTVPRVGEYFIDQAPHTGKAYEIPPEVHFRIVRVTYMRGDGNQMEVSLKLEPAQGSNLDEIAD